MEFFLFWILGAIVVGVFAKNKRSRSGFGWFLLSLVISPVLGFLFAIASRDLRPALEQAMMRKCPSCAEYVKREAHICRYCQHELPPLPSQPVGTVPAF